MINFFLTSYLSFLFLWMGHSPVQQDDDDKQKTKTHYGTASYYANKFEGRKTASGEVFSQQYMTGASNLVPLGTWVKIVNQKNGRTVIVRINDRMHPKMNRVVDLSRTAASKLGYIRSGLTRVKMIVLGKKKPK